MKLTTVKEIYKEREKYLDKEVTVGGWVRSVRDSKTFGFIVLHDGSFFETLQVVYHDTMENFAEISKLNVGAAIIVKGTLVATPQAKQPFEIQAAEVTVEGNSAPDYPLQKKRHSLEYLRTITHLRPRTNTFQAVFRVRSLCAYAIHRFFQEQGFVYVHTPLITGSDCEGAGEMFQVTTLDMNNVPTDDKGAVDYSQDFFGKETNLTVSGQLNCETFAQAFRNVYTFGPTFRAENSNTTRHAAEFWMIEPECAFADLNDNMDLAEAMLKYVIRYVLENAPEEMNFFNSFVDKGLLDRLNHVINSEFGHVTYTEAVELLEKNNDKFDYKVFWGCDLQTEHERYLTEEIFKKPVFVTDYPKEIKAFYMKMNEDNKTVAAMDCLVPGIGEIIGGSQREDDIEKLEKRMDELGLKKEDYDFYLDLRKYGSTRHSGFGLGFERCVMYLTGMGNIRREEEIWETFRRVIAGIRENPVDLLFIAGDLFHRQPLLRELKEVNNLFSTIPDTRVYLMAGNHDYIKADSFYRDFQWEKNVTFFKNEQLTCVKDEKLDVYVYGLSYEHQEIENPLYDSIHPAEGEGVHILLAHGGDAKHIPMNIKSIAASGFDYIALGHIHKPQILIRDNAAYAGALEPVDRNDLGDHGYIEGHLENGRLKTNFVPFACRSYEQILLMLREDSTQASLEDMLKADLANKGRMNIYRIVIQGTRAPELLLLPERLKSFGYVTEVLDESKPSYDLEALQKKYSGTLIGDYISYFLEKDRNAVEEKALYYGLQALLETSR